MPAEPVANSPIDDLLTQIAERFAEKAGVSNQAGAVQEIVSKIRWYQNKAGAIVIVKRGKDRKVLATISPKEGEWSYLYPSWAKVLAELEAAKVANSLSRMSHDGLEMGAVPLAKE